MRLCRNRGSRVTMNGVTILTRLVSVLFPTLGRTRRRTQRWVLAFEIKRSSEAVRSTRYQIQAKGYTETNQDKYGLPQLPRYFAISNLETTVLLALNGTRPPNECRLQGGSLFLGAVCHR